jgi:hypothetical protein
MEVRMYVMERSCAVARGIDINIRVSCFMWRHLASGTAAIAAARFL